MSTSCAIWAPGFASSEIGSSAGTAPVSLGATTCSCHICTGITSWASPFLHPAYIPGNVIRIYGSHKVMREAFQRQQSHPTFPVDFRTLGATIEFVELEPGRNYDIVGGVSVRSFPQNHAG